jgi:hypothetical protein
VVGQDRRDNCKIFMMLWMIVRWWILVILEIYSRGRDERYENGWTGAFVDGIWSAVYRGYTRDSRLIGGGAHNGN